MAKLIELILNQIINFKMRSYRHLKCSETALLLIDMQNDFLVESKEGFKKIVGVGEKVGFFYNYPKILETCRNLKVKVIHSPFETNKAKAVKSLQSTAYYKFLVDNKILNSDSSGVEIPQSIVGVDDHILEPRSTLNAFYGTNLEVYLLKNNIKNIILIGPVANASINSTTRMAVELDFNVVLVKDCVADFSLSNYYDFIKVTLPRIANHIINYEKLKYFLK